MSAEVDISQFARGLEEAHDLVEAAVLKAVDVFGEHVIGDAQQLTPVDTGALQASGTTTPAVLGINEVGKTIGFNTSYAAAVHERVNKPAVTQETKAEFKARKAANRKRGKKTKARNGVGQPKFLTVAMNENEAKFNPFVAGRVDAALQGGAR